MSTALDDLLKQINGNAANSSSLSDPDDDNFGLPSSGASSPSLFVGPPAPPAVASAPSVVAPQASASQDDSDDSDDDSSSSISPILKAYLNNKQSLANAQSQAKSNQETSGLMAGLAQLTHGISRAPGEADLSGVNASAKDDNAPVTNFLQQQASGTSAMQTQKAIDQNDPDSEDSKTFRKSLQLIAPKIAAVYGDNFDNITAADAPDIMKTVDLQAQLQQRAQAAQERTDYMRTKTDAASDQKQTVADQKTAVELQGKLDSSGPRAGNFGKAGAMSMSADRINAILAQFPDGNIPKAQTEELATASAALVGGGSVQSQQQLGAIVPSSMLGDANALAGWLSNDPRGMGQQAFIKNLADSANREKAVADQQMNDIKAQRLSAYNGFANRNPDTFNRIIGGAGLDPTNYDMKTGQYKKPVAQAAQQAPSSKPTTVIQGGNTYTLNPQTGQYE